MVIKLVAVKTPLLASRQGGVAASSNKMPRSLRSRRRRGGFPTAAPLHGGKPPRPRDNRKLRTIFIDRESTPPCLDARRGVLSFPQLPVPCPHPVQFPSLSPAITSS